MRILITVNGENIFSEEEKQSIFEKKFRSTTTNKRYLKKLTIEKISNKDEKNSGTIKSKKKNYFIPAGISYKHDDFFSKTTNTFYPKTIRIATELKNSEKYNKYRKIRINMKKVVFPKVLKTKYEMDKIDYKTDNNDILEEDLKKPDDNRIDINHKLSLGEILNNNSVNKLKNEVKKRERFKEKLSVINEQNFRTNYAFVPKIEELKEILKYKKIKGDKQELIKYINTNNHISDLFLKTLVTSDNNEINKYDKISQTLLFNKDMEVKLKSELLRKVKMNQNMTKVRINNNLNKMDREVKLQQKILDKYQKLFDKKSNYIERHKEIEKIWKKTRINHLVLKNKNIIKKSNDSSNLSDNK